MYNGDSFGYLFDAPVNFFALFSKAKVTGGPYQYFNDPQYVGTTAALIGSALYYRSQIGFGKLNWTSFLTHLVLSVILGLTFYVSVVFVEVILIN